MFMQCYSEGYTSYVSVWNIYCDSVEPIIKVPVNQDKKGYNTCVSAYQTIGAYKYIGNIHL